MHEISNTCTVRDNVVRNNGYLGVDATIWLTNARIIMKSSRDCEIYGNVVSVAPGAGNGITIVNQNRDDDDSSCATVACWAVDNSVHHNDITYLGTAGPIESGPGHSGIVTSFQFDCTDDSMPCYWDYHGNTFDCDVYHYSDVSSDRFAALNFWVDFPTFVGFGFEANGRLNSGLPPACEESIAPGSTGPGITRRGHPAPKRIVGQRISN